MDQCQPKEADTGFLKGGGADICSTLQIYLHFLLKFLKSNFDPWERHFKSTTANLLYDMTVIIAGSSRISLVIEMGGAGRIWGKCLGTLMISRPIYVSAMLTFNDTTSFYLFISWIYKIDTSCKIMFQKKTKLFYNPLFPWFSPVLSNWELTEIHTEIKFVCCFDYLL